MRNKKNQYPNKNKNQKFNRRAVIDETRDKEALLEIKNIKEDKDSIYCTELELYGSHNWSMVFPYSCKCCNKENPEKLLLALNDLEGDKENG